MMRFNNPREKHPANYFHVVMFLASCSHCKLTQPVAMSRQEFEELLISPEKAADIKFNEIGWTLYDNNSTLLCPGCANARNLAERILQN